MPDLSRIYSAVEWYNCRSAQWHLISGTMRAHSGYYGLEDGGRGTWFLGRRST